MRAILIGATGLVGGILLNELLANPLFTHVKLISRRTTGIQHARLEESIINFDDETAFKKEVANAEVLFCCIGTTQKKVKGDKAAYRKVDFDIPVNAAKFCAEQQIGKYLLVSAVGANIDSSNFYLRLKGETEAAVLSQSIGTIYIMRPCMLLGYRKESRTGEAIGGPIMQFLSLFLFGNASKYKSIHAGDVAKEMFAAAAKTTTGKFICHYREMMELIKKQ